MIVSVTLNPAVDHQVFVNDLQLHDTNRVVRTEVDAGGKGINLSRVFAELGGETKATGFLGGRAGAVICQVLEKQGVQEEFIQIAGETRLNISIEDHSGQPPTTFNDRGPEISNKEYEEFLQRLEAVAEGATWICMGGSLPRGVATDAYFEIGTLARKLGCKVLLDADKEACIEGLKAYPNFIKPNQAEASRILGRELNTTEEVVAGATDLYQGLAENSEDAIVVISRGADGAVLVCGQGKFLGRSAPVEARSTIGSGDSFLGAMLWAMEEGCDLMESFRWGLAAGAATATTDGTEIARKGVCQLLYGHTQVEPL